MGQPEDLSGLRRTHHEESQAFTNIYEASDGDRRETGGEWSNHEESQGVTKSHEYSQSIIRKSRVVHTVL